MKQFDVYPNPSPRSRERIPIVVVVQSHLFVSNTTLVAPMIPHDRRSAFTETSIDVRVGDGGYIVLIGELAVIETRHLQRPVSSLREHKDAIRRVLDRLFTGFCAYDFRWTAKSARSSSAERQLLLDAKSASCALAVAA